LASFTSSPNPFIKQTALQFTLTRMTYITIAVYDELGRLVWGDGKGSSLSAGTHSILIDGSSLPQGTVYARISTGFGEVRTVKLVHE
ncbi:MAG: T9SS type A sorting domain-containing protein, partial [Bacteroidota bacterium]|nr:T9SS type A sorting domain-containing protein [Bacteroidota bacterium]